MRHIQPDDLFHQFPVESAFFRDVIDRQPFFRVVNHRFNLPVYIAAAGTGAAADMIYAWSDALVSALNPEAAAVIMLGDDLGGALKDSKDPQKDKAEFIKSFTASELNAVKAAAAGYVDGIIDPAATRETIINAVEMLCNKRVSTLPKKHCTSI